MRKLLFLCFLLGVIFGPIVFLAMAMETTPAVGKSATTTGADAARAKAVLEEFWKLAGSGAATRQLEVSQADINSIIAFASRAVPTLRGEATVAPGGIDVASSMRVPGIPGGGWLNLHVGIEPSARGLHLGSVKLGTYDLPAGMVLPAARILMDLAFGDRVGTIAVNSIDGVSISGRNAIVGIALSGEDFRALTKRLRPISLRINFQSHARPQEKPEA